MYFVLLQFRTDSKLNRVKWHSRIDLVSTMRAFWRSTPYARATIGTDDDSLAQYYKQNAEHKVEYQYSNDNHNDGYIHRSTIPVNIIKHSQSNVAMATKLKNSVCPLFGDENFSERIHRCTTQGCEFDTQSANRARESIRKVSSLRAGQETHAYRINHDVQC
jgi:hypothetical protein